MTFEMEDEDYWNSSTTTGFSFDDEIAPVSSLFDSSRSRRESTSRVVNSIFSEYVEKPSGFKPIGALLSKRSLSCVLGEDIQKKVEIDSTEELSFLRKQFATRWERQPVAATIISIRLGKPYSLELYRSLEAKTELLSEAVSSGDGNAILPVLLYLQNTLKRKLLCGLLQSHPSALPVYINYLSTRFEAKSVMEILQMLGHPREAAMRDFKFAIQPNQHIDRRLQRLKCLIRDHYSSPDAEDKLFIDNFMNYVDWQVTSGRKQAPLLGTVMTSLMYLCSHHWELARDQPLSPQTFTSLLGVSEIMFHWTAIVSLAGRSNWNHISGLVLTKGWMGGKKLRTVVPVERIVTELHRRNAPETFTMEFFSLIENYDKQLNLARKLLWHRAAIDTFVAMKDRQGLAQYQASSNLQSSDSVYAETAIKSNIKWKN